jgi:hypothetical protein
VKAQSSSKRAPRESIDPASALGYPYTVSASDDEVLRLMILPVLTKAGRPMDPEELAERIFAMMGVRFIPERGH